MKIKKLLDTTKMNITSAAGKARLRVVKYSPEILLGAGLVSLAATVVTACRATLKADEVLTVHNKRMKDIDDAYEIATSAEENGEEPYEYDHDLYVHDKRLIQVQTGVKMIRLYAPSVALAALTVTSILASRNILNKRYLGAVAAYNTVSELFEQYRDRVREEQGEMMDRHYRFGTDLEERVIEEVDENGKKHRKKELVEVPGTGTVNLEDTARWFDRSNVNWQENPHYGLMFLKGKQNYLNDRLHINGCLTLNEVYDALGYEPTSTGAIVGWIDNRDHSVYVDFGIFDPEDENRRRFVNGTYDCILLEFNTQGIIWDKLDQIDHAANTFPDER